VPSADITKCLENAFGRPIDKVTIIEKVKPADYKWGATTRKNEITIVVPCDVFFNDPDTYLEEYYHVLEQWNTGRLSRLLLALSTLFAGCAFRHPARESAFAVKGRILVDNREAASDCSLHLYRLPQDREIREVDIPPDFQTSVIIVPGIHKYYMSIRCSGTSTYKTQTYELGSTRHWGDPIDLGEIHLTQAKSN
jgi:hypothetical protein